MKKAELIFGAILLPIDYLMLIAAGLTAYFLRFDTSFAEMQVVTHEIPFNSYAALVAITALAWLLIFGWTGLYNIRGTRRIVDEARKIFMACSTGVMAIIVLFFFERDLFSSRFIILAAYGLSLLYVTSARLIVLMIERQLFKQGIGIHNVVVVGAGHVANIVKNEFTNNKSLGFHVKFQIDRFNEHDAKKILSYKDQGAIDEIIVADPDISRQESEQIYEFCDENHLVFKYAAALLDTQLANIAIRPIGGIPIVEVKRTRLDGWGRIAKRIFDIVGSLLLIIITSPIMLLAALAIRLDSKGPIFFSRKDDGAKVTRVGQFNKPFIYFKFRTMKPGTDSMRYDEELQEKNVRKDSPLVKIKDDPRVTRVGRFLRRTSIDELPEFFLVLKGRMSLVGPRPHLPEEVAKYTMHQRRVLNIKPGVTGMAQVSGRSDLDFEDEVRLDTFYLEKWSIWLDIIILLKTPLILLNKRKAL